MLLFSDKGYILSIMEESQNKRAFKAQRHDITFLTVYNTGTEKCRAGHCWGPAVRDHFLIHFIVGGKGVYTLAGKDYSLSRGDLFFAPPGESVLPAISVSTFNLFLLCLQAAILQCFIFWCIDLISEKINGRKL